MAVPMSPDQVDDKANAIRKFLSTSDDTGEPVRNRQIAGEYDALGMAEYEAIEAFQAWK